MEWCGVFRGEGFKGAGSSAHPRIEDYSPALDWANTGCLLLAAT